MKKTEKKDPVNEALQHAGEPTVVTPELRALDQEPIEMLALAIETYKPDICIIDGIAGLLDDINSGPASVELMQRLLTIASVNKCNITAMIHLNRSGEKLNLRGMDRNGVGQKRPRGGHHAAMLSSPQYTCPPPYREGEGCMYRGLSMSFSSMMAEKWSMAKLIRELKTRFQKARILGHRDLPGVRKACPCYDVAKDQIAEKPFQDLKNLPQIRGRPMPGGQKHEPDSGHVFARGAERRTSFEPQISQIKKELHSQRACIPHAGDVSLILCRKNFIVFLFPLLTS